MCVAAWSTTGDERPGAAASLVSEQPVDSFRLVGKLLDRIRAIDRDRLSEFDVIGRFTVCIDKRQPVVVVPAVVLRLVDDFIGVYRREPSTQVKDDHYPVNTCFLTELDNMAPGIPSVEGRITGLPFACCVRSHIVLAQLNVYFVGQV